MQRNSGNTIIYNYYFNTNHLTFNFNENIEYDAIIYEVSFNIPPITIHTCSVRFVSSYFRLDLLDFLPVLPVPK